MLSGYFTYNQKPDTMVQIRFLRQAPTGIEVEIVATGQRMTLSRSFIRKQIDAGIYEVVNHKEMPAVL